MSRVILHAGHPLDDARHPRERPEVRAEAMRAGAFAQRRFNTDQLLRSQPGLAASAPRGPQRRTAALAPRAIPSHHALATDAQAPSNGPVRLSTRGEQPRGLVATNFQSVEIPSWRNVSGHAPSYDGKAAIVTVLCETQ